MPLVWAVLGPTASGKSKAALLLAQRLGGEIISCDSVQVYRHFNIGSAKPSFQDQALVPHHLIDILPPNAPCTAGFWRDRALAAVDDVLGRGKVPIITGGTGLYFKALFQGLFEGTSTNPAVRSRLEIEAQTLGLPALYARLQTVDAPYALKINPNDKLRIIRALEAFEVTGQPFSALHSQNTKPGWQWKLTMPIIAPEALEKSIIIRTQKMLAQGLIAETQGLIQKFPQAPALNSIGYKETRSYLTEGGSIESLTEQIILHTRQLAKRQRTLFKSLFKGYEVSPPEDFL